MKLDASNFATELGRYLTLLILNKKGPLTRNELLVFWTDLFRSWDRVQLQPGFFYPMLSSLEEKGILETVGKGRVKTYRIAEKYKVSVEAYLNLSIGILDKISDFAKR